MRNIKLENNLYDLQTLNSNGYNKNEQLEGTVYDVLISYSSHVFGLLVKNRSS